MTNRIKVQGYIDLPEAADLPALGSVISGEYRAEVDAHVDRQEKRRGEFSKVTHTARATIAEDGGTMARIEPPIEQPKLGDEDEPAPVGSGEREEA